MRLKYVIACFEIFEWCSFLFVMQSSTKVFMRLKYVIACFEIFEWKLLRLFLLFPR